MATMAVKAGPLFEERGILEESSQSGRAGGGFGISLGRNEDQSNEGGRKWPKDGKTQTRDRWLSPILDRRFGAARGGEVHDEW